MWSSSSPFNAAVIRSFDVIGNVSSYLPNVVLTRCSSRLRGEQSLCINLLCNILLRLIGVKRVAVFNKVVFLPLLVKRVGSLVRLLFLSPIRVRLRNLRFDVLPPLLQGCFHILGELRLFTGQVALLAGIIL